MSQKKLPIAVLRARAHEDAGNFGQAGREWLLAGVAAERAEIRLDAVAYAKHAARCYRKWERQIMDAVRPRPHSRQA